MYRKHLPSIMVKISLVVILGLEILITSILVLGIYDLIVEKDIYLSEIGLTMSGLLFIILLIGLRVLKDYKSASRTTIYFLLTVFGLFWLQLI